MIYTSGSTGDAEGRGGAARGHGEPAGVDAGWVDLGAGDRVLQFDVVAGFDVVGLGAAGGAGGSGRVLVVAADAAGDPGPAAGGG